MIDITEKERKRLLNTREAVDYLNTIHPDLDLKIDTFRHRVARKPGVPHTERTYGSVRRWYFRPEDLNNMKFRKNEPVSRDTQLDIVESVRVQNAADLVELQKQFGPLVNDDGMLCAMQEKTGHKYSRGALRARRHRGTIIWVAITGGAYPQYWYPLNQIQHMDFQPEVAMRVKS